MTRDEMSGNGRINLGIRRSVQLPVLRSPDSPSLPELGLGGRDVAGAQNISRYASGSITIAALSPPRKVASIGARRLSEKAFIACAANRVPQVVIQDLVGHGSPAMTALYSHADFEQKKDAIHSLPDISFTNDKQGKKIKL